MSFFLSYNSQNTFRTLLRYTIPLLNESMLNYAQTKLIHMLKWRTKAPRQNDTEKSKLVGFYTYSHDVMLPHELKWLVDELAISILPSSSFLISVLAVMIAL